MAHVHMDEVAGHYDATISAHVQAHYLRKRIDAVRKRLKQGRILDVGCGTGRLAEALRKEGFMVFGIDESTGMLHEAQEERGIIGCCGSSAEIPLATGAFDAAICIATLHHVRDPELVRKTLSEMVRVVRSGGWVLIWDHNPLNPYWPIFMKRLPQDQEPTRLVPMAELIADLRSAGVQRIEAWRSGLVPDFAPRPLLGVFQALEWIVERTPLLRGLCAHNVVVGYKP